MKAGELRVWRAGHAHDVEIVDFDTDLRLCRFFGLSDGYWLRAQAAYDTEVTKDALADVLAKIKPMGHA